MKKSAVLLFVVFGLLLMLSSILSQAAYRLDKTLLSYTYMSREIEAVARELDDAVLRETSARDTIDYINKAFGLDIPDKLDPYLYRAAYNAFTADWYARTGKRMLFNTLHVISGKESGLSLPISIQEYKLALLEIARSELTAYEYVEIDREVSSLPFTVELADTFIDGKNDRVLRLMRRIEPALLSVTYIIPGVFLILCFVPLRIGGGFTAAGSGIFAGGAAVLVFASGLRSFAAERAGSAVMESIPPFFVWAGGGIDRIVAKLISGMLPLAIVVTAAGFCIAAAGLALVKFRGDKRFYFRRSH